MSRKIFVNLPVKNLEASLGFFQSLGFSFNPQYSDSSASCMIVSDDIFVMLLNETRFQTFTPKPLCNAHTHTEMLLCLSCDSHNEVDDIVAKAVAAGGHTYNDPQDHGFMYAHGFQDLDGHIWELVFMAPPL
ncbi:glyoxalase/bleomycin resistance/extradiol dioxygenase family protein [Iodobacter sp. HSC-16F04]|uniref:Glyoxalase/bleomycin resistance/extradiol dioxygenase family protein n=1 Tax=Iodobacter violaceini TaxID=3044271 RepID=A0ABX0KNZ9_9NEIS|nr:VOC family protein [Iodobacter violacea]NHQ85239.1 glyoxalase/bleomycin resistance/extradiol dioxygenase family protein [Iodobacter violacea]